MQCIIMEKHFNQINTPRWNNEKKNTSGVSSADISCYYTLPISWKWLKCLSGPHLVWTYCRHSIFHFQVFLIPYHFRYQLNHMPKWYARDQAHFLLPFSFFFYLYCLSLFPFLTPPTFSKTYQQTYWLHISHLRISYSHLSYYPVLIHVH